MRRLAARRLGGPEDTKPPIGRHRVVVAGGLAALLLLVTGTAVWWSRDRPATPASVRAPPATRAPADPAALQRQLDGVVETGALGVVALVRSGQQTWQGASGLGDLAAKRPARAGDRFRIGSVTKSFVATVALQLVGEGKLGLDDHLERWLPGLVPNGDAITVRQLLNHTSGLYDYTDDLPEPPDPSSRGSWSPSPPGIGRCSRPGTGSPTATPTTSWPAWSSSGSPASGWLPSSSSASLDPWTLATPSYP
jgi:D-alanyl-D-alanine carboxypeptidase